MSRLTKGRALRELALGLKAQKSLAASATANIFTTYGRVMITALIGQVTTAEASGATIVKLTELTNSVDLCADTTVTGDAIGTMYILTGDCAVILCGTANAPVIDVAHGLTFGINPVVLGRKATANAIKLTASTPSATLVVLWTIFYIPLDDDAYVVAA